ncbi:MAG: hypothetical protein KJO07_13575 [Deltaproteobacteria bacterium]|nr:hypothetical protein [Deltaproteobacteria bacterium]
MPAIARRFFGKGEAERIESLIAEVEGKTDAEIVLCVTSRSVDSTATDALAAFATGLGAVAATWLLAQKVHVSAAGAVLLLGLPAVLGLFVGGAALGLALTRSLPAFGVWFTTEAQRRRHVERKAAMAFHDLEIRGTSAGTGLLVFVSLQERTAHVVADGAILRAVPEPAWQHLRDIVQGSFAARHAVDGVVRAIEYSGEILEEHVPATGEAGNQLDNRVRYL